MLSLFQQGFEAVFSLQIFGLVFFGTVVGIIFGAIPGLTATMAVALFLPITYSLGAAAGISLLVALYIGGGKIVHAANPRSGVNVAGLNSMPITGVRRVVG